jgi:archaellum component FlaC
MDQKETDVMENTIGDKSSTDTPGPTGEFHTGHDSIEKQRSRTSDHGDTESPMHDDKGRSSFEQFVMASLEKIMAGQNSIKNDLESFKRDIEKAVEFQGEEIEELKAKQSNVSKKVEDLNTQLNNTWDSIFTHRKHVSDLWDGVNKVERHTRRNNIRIIGVPENDGENVTSIVDDIFVSKFDVDDIEIERAHRDGKRHTGKGSRPRHILVKLLRYTDKVDVMKRRRDCLKMESFHIVEDLTAADLEDKQKWSESVNELYKRGIKFRYVAGLWRDKHGKRAPFYNKPNEVDRSPMHNVSLSKAEPSLNVS